jgi:hypothetical protein
MPKSLFVTRAARRIERRMFLKAMALGASVPVAARLARVATAAPSAAPKRLFIFYTPHGTAPEHYAPKIAGDTYDPTKAVTFNQFDLDQTNVSILGPLQQYKQWVNVYQGFQYPGSAATHEGVVDILSGLTNSDGTGSTDTTTPRTTIDQLIGKALNVKPLILGACSHQPYGLDNHGMLFWNGTPIDPQKNPVAAADALFGGSGGSPTAPTADVQLHADLLNFTQSEIQTMRGTLTGLTREQNKLDTYLSAIQSLQSSSSTMTGQNSCSSKPSLPTVEMVRSLSAGNDPGPSGGNDYFYQAANFPLLLQAQLEVVAQALICNAAPIIGLMPMYATCDFDFGFAGAPGSHHTDLSHSGYQASSSAQYNSPISVSNLQATARTPFATAQKWFTTQLVNKVVSLLATTDDPAAPGTKVLDNTIIFWLSEVGDGNDHNRVSEILYPQVPDSIPLVTIGGGAGALKTGLVVRYPIDTNAKASTVNRMVPDLLITLGKAMGAGALSMPHTTGVVSEVLA